jgi:NAD(P)-dependent dehydrogenase (short-subunit alcohol dehydrogenase family)
MSWGPNTTTDEVLEGQDLSGKVAVVTGATSGLGLETARALAAHGATVVLTGRDGDKLAAALATVAEQVAAADLSGQMLDLASLAGVRTAAEELVAAHPTIDVLINNAGVMACPLSRTEDGFEMQFGTNHLGHFLLTNLLRPALVAAGSARVVCLSSGGHQESPIRWDDPNFERTPYVNWTAYGQSKTANALFALELDRRWRGEGVHAYAVHPGVIMTPLARHMTDADFEWMAARAERARAAAGGRAEADPFSFKSVQAGAATTVWAATAAELAEHGGAYLADCQLAQLLPEGGASATGVVPWARDPDAARRLWDLSATLVGLEPA